MRIVNGIAAVMAVSILLFATHLHAQAPERRFALVIGNSEYKAGRLPTAANDAGLVAQSLRAAGFDVTGARDLDQNTLRRSMREFLDKIAAALADDYWHGEQTVALIYLAGYGLQFEGENYIVPVDAGIRRNEDIPIEAVRISDFTRPLAGMPRALKLFIVDTARQHPFTPAGTPLASGLALVEPDPSMLVAFNAAPGSIAPIEPGPYGAYAQSLAEMIGTGGLGLDDLFTRLRLRVNEKTGGLAVPWYASKIIQPFPFMEPSPDAPPQTVSNAQLQSQPIGEFRGDQEAYAAAVARDTLQGYQDFLAAYPDNPLAARVRALIAVRREAMTWRRAVAIDTQEAFWSYLRRYTKGAHVADAQRRLSRLAAAADPPASFTPVADLDVPPPPPDEVAYLNQPQIVFDGPGFLPPPPVPVYFLPPPPPAFMVLAPPPPPIGAFFLPVPLFTAHPWGRPPAFVLSPPAAPIQRITINNVTIINQREGGTLPATTLPATVVTRVNSGALKPPPPGAPPPAPIHRVATLMGAGPLGHPTTLPGRARPTAIAVPATATAVPGTAPTAVTLTTAGRPQGPDTAAALPGASPNTGPLDHPATLPPNPPRPTAIAVPAEAETGVVPLTRTPGPATATAVPGTAPTAVTATTAGRPQGPDTAAALPGASPSTGLLDHHTTLPPSPARPTGIAVPAEAQTGVAPLTRTPGPATATAVPGTAPAAVTATTAGRPQGPDTAAALPGASPNTGAPDHHTTLPPGPARPTGIAVPAEAQTGVAPFARTPGPGTATAVPGTAPTAVTATTAGRPQGPDSAAAVPDTSPNIGTPVTHARAPDPASTSAAPDAAATGSTLPTTARPHEHGPASPVVPPATGRTLGPGTATAPPRTAVGTPGQHQPGGPVVGSATGSSPQSRPVQKRQPAGTPTASTTTEEHSATTASPWGNFNWLSPSPPPAAPAPAAASPPRARQVVSKPRPAVAHAPPSAPPVQ